MKPRIFLAVFLCEFLLAGMAGAESKFSTSGFADMGRRFPYSIRVEGVGSKKSDSMDDFQRNTKEKKEECRSFGGTQFLFIYGRPETQKTEDGFVTAAVARCE